MEINYCTSSTIFYPFQVANKHFRMAFASNHLKNLQELWKNNVVQDVSPISLFGRVKHLILGAFEYIPFFGVIIAIVDRYFYHMKQANVDPRAKQAIIDTPNFNSYAFENDKKFHLTDIGIRPANLFFKALFGGHDPTTQPGSGELFGFKPSWYPSLWSIHRNIFSRSDSQVISFSAKGEKAHFYQRNRSQVEDCGEKELGSILGTNVYQISAKEIKDMLNGQRIYISPLIPRTFYLEMKKALDADKFVVLPGDDYHPVMMHEIMNSNRISALVSLLNEVKKNPAKFGFIDNGTMLSFDQFLALSLYQVGSMIVKKDGYRALVENGYCIAKRIVGEKDEICLISASGIRGFFAAGNIPGNENHQIDRKIMKHTFKTALEAAGKNAHVIFPAVGMGVWGGDPNIYWRAFLDAVVESDIDTVFINPRHQPSPSGPYSGYSGEEFALILAEYKRTYPASESLKKIFNLFEHKTDLLLLAKNLKKAFPDKTIALFNASDPDVTLGNHVGEYGNNLCHASTTEENLLGAGTSGLGFEWITKVRESLERVIQAH